MMSSDEMVHTWLSDGARQSMVESAMRAYPNEMGGVLIGVMAGRRIADHPWVTHAVEVPSTRCGNAHYELPAGARQEIVMRMRNHDARLGYLGDWHSHPLDVGPSNTDIASISAASVTGDCALPLLFIVRRSESGYQIDARQWTGTRLRRLKIVGAGSLESARRPRPSLPLVAWF